VPLEPVETDAATSPPVALSSTSTPGTLRPDDVTTSTVTSPSWPTVSFSGSVARTL
jgi:hypothetical protein